MLSSLVPMSEYMDRKFPGDKAAYDKAIAESTCLYVGNLSFYTKEEQIAEIFGKAGELERVVMGLDRNEKTPCGFCFVIFKTRQGAERAVSYLNGTMLDERDIRADFDWGYEEGRQYGRGKSGGQMRDEYRTEYDASRGGYGKVMKAELEAMGGGFGSPGFGSPGFGGAGAAGAPYSGGAGGPGARKRARGSGEGAGNGGAGGAGGAKRAREGEAAQTAAAGDSASKFRREEELDEQD